MPTEEQSPFISVIIPCYNEEKNLESGVLDEVYQYLKEQSYTWEVIVSNDESTDNSRALVESFIQDKPRFSLVDIPHGFGRQDSKIQRRQLPWPRPFLFQSNPRCEGGDSCLLVEFRL